MVNSNASLTTPPVPEAVPGRVKSRVFIAILKPSPSSPSLYSTGTRTSWKASADVSVARWPILSRCFSTVTPSSEVGTTNAESPLCPLLLSVEAKTTSQSAWPAFVMNIFEPLMTYSSPSRTAVVWIPETSDPACGSLRPNEQRIGFSTGGRRPRRLSPPPPGDPPRCRSGRVGHDRDRDPGAAPGQFLADQHPVEARQPEAAVLLRYVRIHQAELVCLLENVRRMGRVLVVLGCLRTNLLLREVARELPQLALLVRERKGHARRRSLFDHCHVRLAGVD